jgi:hypothetical protein
MGTAKCCFEDRECGACRERAGVPGVHRSVADSYYCTRVQVSLWFLFLRSYYTSRVLRTYTDSYRMVMECATVANANASLTASLSERFNGRAGTSAFLTFSSFCR